MESVGDILDSRSLRVLAVEFATDTVVVLIELLQNVHATHFRGLVHLRKSDTALTSGGFSSCENESGPFSFRRIA